VSVRYFRCLVCFKHYHRSEWRLLGQEILSEDLIAVGRVFAKDAAKYIGVLSCVGHAFLGTPFASLFVPTLLSVIVSST
jgi:hypothetical protein